MKIYSHSSPFNWFAHPHYFQMKFSWSLFPTLEHDLWWFVDVRNQRQEMFALLANMSCPHHCKEIKSHFAFDATKTKTTVNVRFLSANCKHLKAKHPLNCTLCFRGVTKKQTWNKSENETVCEIWTCVTAGCRNWKSSISVTWASVSPSSALKEHPKLSSSEAKKKLFLHSQNVSKISSDKKLLKRGWTEVYLRRKEKKSFADVLFCPE